MPKPNKKAAGKPEATDEIRRTTPRSTRQQSVRPDSANSGTPTSPNLDADRIPDDPTINLAIQDLDIQVALSDIGNKAIGTNANGISTAPVVGTPRQHSNSSQSEDFIDLYNKLEAMENKLKRATIEISLNKSALETAHRNKDILENKVMFLGQRVSELEHLNNKLQFQIDSTENYSRAKNIKIDGITENPGEDLKEMICHLAREEGKEVNKSDIEAAFRIGRPNLQSKRPRQIMIKFKCQALRNDVLFNKGQLKGKEAFRRVWINDDVSEGTRKLREEARTVNLLCKEQGITNTKMHGDGIVINDKKFKLNELKSLPENQSLEKAKTIQRGSRIYFHSECSKFSNFYRCEVRTPEGHFTSSEQAFQWRKAIYAKEYELARLIKLESNPVVQKKLGDRIVNSIEWNEIRVQNMLEIVFSKFNATPALKSALLETDVCTLHEATKDPYWGIGATLYSEEAKQHSWRGKNQLGNILINVRATLKQTTV